jgi:hypothetical protein
MSLVIASSLNAKSFSKTTPDFARVAGLRSGRHDAETASTRPPFLAALGIFGNPT